MNIQKKAVNLTDIAIGIIVLGIIVSIGASVLINMRDTRLTGLPTVTTANESVTASPTTLTNSWVQGITSVQNNSVNIASGNYTASISSGNGYLTLTNTSATYHFPWNVTYTWYNTSRADWSLANNSALGLAEYGNWFKILVIVAVASVILGLIFMAFGKAGSSESSGGSY
jgi:hypothetical protein